VALQQATEPVATFQAPIVHAPSALTFRLVVTDDLGASATARVTITVVPGVVGLHQRGLALLKEPLRPEPPAGDCPPCEAHLGLWLGARVQAVATARDPEIDRLLDELRVLMIERASAAAAPREPPAERMLLDLGLRVVAAFTEERDPATARFARSVLGRDAEPEPVTAAAWAAAIAEALPDLAGPQATLADLQNAGAHLLGGDLDGVDPAAIAAATLLLTLKPEVETPAAVRLP
jgi:hypothetical protein